MNKFIDLGLTFGIGTYIGAGIYRHFNMGENSYPYKKGYEQACFDMERYNKDKKLAQDLFNNGSLKTPKDLEEWRIHYFEETNSLPENKFKQHELANNKYFESLLQEAYAEKCRKENDAHGELCTAENIFDRHLKPAPFTKFVRDNNLL